MEGISSVSSDAVIVARVLRGDVDAYGVLVERYRDRYARYAFHMLGNREDAEEALGVLEKVAGTDESSPVAWEARAWAGRCYF